MANGSLSRIFRSLNPWRNREDEQDSATAPPPPFINIDEKKSEAEIVADIKDALAHGADVNAAAWASDTPLNRACSLGLAEAVKVLIEAGAPVNPPAGSHTPFMSAAEGIRPDIMQLLVDKGADPTAPDSIPQDAMVKFFLARPWEQAKEPGFEDRDRACLQFLLDHGLHMEDWNKKTIYTSRPHLMPLTPELYKVKEFEEAGKNGEQEKVRQMIEAGMPVDAPATYGGASPMAIAAERNDLDMVNMLLDHGADLENWCQGMTPIMAAARAGSEGVFVRLLRAGADITKKYTYDRYPDTTVVELAGMCKTNPDMKAFAADAIAHRNDPIVVDTDMAMEHKVKVGKPLHLKLAMS